MSFQKWKEFFQESGLPDNISENYAGLFIDNRIRFDMLEELNKEILHDMGIRKMGDVISVLRHAKNACKEKLPECNPNLERQAQSKQGVPSVVSKIASKQLIKADSTMTSNGTRNIVGNTQTSKDSRVVVDRNEPVRIVVDSNRETQNSGPSKGPVVVCNLGSLSYSSISRKRVEPPGPNELSTKQPELPRKVMKVADKSFSSIQVSKPISIKRSSLPIKPPKKEFNEKNRTTNLAKHIQHALNSSSDSSKLTPIKLTRPTKTPISSSNSQHLPVKSRLTMPPDSTSSMVAGINIKGVFFGKFVPKSILLINRLFQIVLEISDPILLPTGARQRNLCFNVLASQRYYTQISFYIASFNSSLIKFFFVKSKCNENLLKLLSTT